MGRSKKYQFLKLTKLDENIRDKKVNDYYNNCKKTYLIDKKTWTDNIKKSTMSLSKSTTNFDIKQLKIGEKGSQLNPPNKKLMVRSQTKKFPNLLPINSIENKAKTSSSIKPKFRYIPSNQVMADLILKTIEIPFFDN